MNKTITYRQLFQFLKELGFVDKSIPDSHVGFYHESTDTWLLFGLRDQQEAAAPHDIVKVRNVLDARGLMERDDFDEFIHSHQRGSRKRGRRSTA